MGARLCSNVPGLRRQGCGRWLHADAVRGLLDRDSATVFSCSQAPSVQAARALTAQTQRNRGGPSMNELLSEAFSTVEDSQHDPEAFLAAVRRRSARRRRARLGLTNAVAVTACAVLVLVWAGPHTSDHHGGADSLSTVAAGPDQAGDAFGSLRGGAIIKPLTVDGGALRLDPATEPVPPGVNRASLLADARSSSSDFTQPGMAQESQPEVVYALVTVRSSVERRDGLDDAPVGSVLATFSRRPAFVVLWTNRWQPGFCAFEAFGRPVQAAGPPPPDVRVQAVIQAAGSAADTVRYQSRGELTCGGVAGPFVSVPERHASVAWTASPGPHPDVTYDAPSCSRLAGVGGSRAYGVMVAIPFGTNCPVVARSAGALMRGPTGHLAVGLLGNGTRFPT